MTTSDTLPPWPQVPACYGWLSLDRRGGWRLRGEPVEHGGLLAFLNHNYRSDGGDWFVQNGPQRVFVSLAYTPLVLRLQTDGRITTHTGADAGAARTVHVDDEGNVLVLTEAGIGLVDDRDLPDFIGECRLADGEPAEVEAVLAGEGVSWRGLPLRAIARAEVAGHYRFRPDPQA